MVTKINSSPNQTSIGPHNNIIAGINFLKKVDSKLGLLIDKFGAPELEPSHNYFESLTRSIIYQQLSGKAAGTIYKRFLNIYHFDSFPLPSDVLKTEETQLRSVGLSYRKASYVLALAEAFNSQNFLPEDLDKLNNIQISELLIQIRGIGQWTADMFLIFSLNRLDIIPLTDLGIQKGMKEFFNLNELPSDKKMLRLSKKWKPYRSIASLYMWKIVDNGLNW